MRGLETRGIEAKGRNNTEDIAIRRTAIGAITRDEETNMEIGKKTIVTSAIDPIMTRVLGTIKDNTSPRDYK